MQRGVATNEQPSTIIYPEWDRKERRFRMF